jgi:hypothetical protein
VDAIVIAHRHKVLRDQDRESIAALLAEASRPVFVFDAWNVWRPAQEIDGVRYEGLGFVPAKSSR